MALALSGKVGIAIQLNQTNALDLTTPTDSLNLTPHRAISSGTGADQSDVLFHDQRTLTTGGTEELALNDGSLSNAFGTLTLDKLKGICIRNHSTTDSLLIGGAAATQVGLFNDTSDILKLQPGSSDYPSVFLQEAPAAAGLDVTTNDTIKLTHNADTTNSLTYDIIIWGED
jgi:hypothetical protein